MKKRVAWNKNKRMTQVTKRRISAALKGRTTWNKGKSWSNSVKKKISQSRKGKTSWNKGRNWSVNIKKKISRTKIFPEAKFKGLYDLLETKFSSNYLEIDNWIKNSWNNVPLISCSRCEETLPTHIRHCFHHKKHGTYLNKDLLLSIKELSKLVRTLNK